MRILEGRAAENYVRKLEQRGQRLDALEPRVRRIVQSVRRDGDKALRRYAEQWDGSAAGMRCGFRRARCGPRCKGSSPELRSALETAAGNIRNFCQWQKPREWVRREVGPEAGPVGAAAQFRGMLCARRPLSPALNFADDGDSGAGCGREGNSRGFTSPGAGSNT